MRAKVKDGFESANAQRLIIIAHVDSLHSKVVTAWDAGEVYHLTTSREGGQEMHAVVVASIGTLNITHEEAPGTFPKTVGFQTKSCENAWGSTMPHLSHTTRWDPPAEVPAAGLCVEFSAAQASTKNSAYQVNMVRLHMVPMHSCC